MVASPVDARSGAPSRLAPPSSLLPATRKTYAWSRVSSAVCLVATAQTELSGKAPSGPPQPCSLQSKCRTLFPQRLSYFGSAGLCIRIISPEAFGLS